MKKFLLILLCFLTTTVFPQSFSYDNPLMRGSGREIQINDGTIIKNQRYSQYAIDDDNSWRRGSYANGNNHEQNHIYTCPRCGKTFYWNDYKGRYKDGIWWSGNGRGDNTCWDWITWIPNNHPCNVPIGSALILLLPAVCYAYKVHRKR